jgi:uncharacterized membrane protein
MPKRGRIDAIDAARGCAMVLVCLSHTKRYFEHSAPLFYDALTWLTLTATPTFLLLSGFIAAYVLRGDDQRRIAITLVDRGLFLLLVAHVLLGLEDLPRTSLFEWLFVRVTITDAIGVALCLAVLFRHASAGMLFAVGASLCASSWLIGMTLAVESVWANHLGSLLFGMRSAPRSLVVVPLLPYIGVFLIGMGLSTWLKDEIAAGDERVLARRLLIVGSTAATAVVAAALAWHEFKELLPPALSEPHVTELLRSTINPATKWPPGPGYLLFYGGGGLLMAGWFFYGRPRWLVSRIVEKASVLGRASLMCFVVQDWLLFVTPAAFGFSELQSPVFWMTYFGACVLSLYVLAGAWGRVQGNRFLTIGLKRLVLGPQKKRSARVASDPSDPAAARR